MPIPTLNRRMLLVSGASTLTFACSARVGAHSQDAGPNGTWRDGPALPFAAQEIYPTMHGGQIHLAGGFIAENGTITGATNRHIALDLGSSTWNELTPLPVARHHPNLISFNGKLLAIGGFEARSETAVWVMQSGIWVFDDFGWTDTQSLPQPNGESVTDVIGDRLHVCGGRHPVGTSNATWNDHSDIDDHFVLTDLGSTWERAAPLPTARNSAASAVLRGNWHVVGGRTVASGNTPAHEVYDPVEDRWRTAAPMPQGQGGLAAAAVGGKLYAFGGEYFNDGGGVYPQAWEYDPRTDAWSAIPDMPNPRHGLGAVTASDAIYVIGGALEVGGSQTSVLVEIFTP
nr:kelch repeat-containing protein [Hyphomonas sp. Mor2]